MERYKHRRREPTTFFFLKRAQKKKKEHANIHTTSLFCIPKRNSNTDEGTSKHNIIG